MSWGWTAFGILLAILAIGVVAVGCLMFAMTFRG